MPDDRPHAFIVKGDVLRLKAGGFYLFRDQKAPRDFDLFLFGVAGQAKNLHAVLQRLRNRVHDVGRRNEHHLRKIVLHVEVVIPECAILFGIEYLQKRG